MNKNRPKYRTVGICDFKKQVIIVSRDQWGHFYVDSNARVVQNKINAEECVRYLLNAMQGVK